MSHLTSRPVLQPLISPSTFLSPLPPLETRETPHCAHCASRIPMAKHLRRYSRHDLELGGLRQSQLERCLLLETKHGARCGVESGESEGAKVLRIEQCW